MPLTIVHAYSSYLSYHNQLVLILAAILISLLVPLGVLGLSFTRLRVGLLWLSVVAGSLVAWILVIFAGNQLPIEIFLLNWQPESLFGSPPGLLVDEISWPFAVAVMTLPLSVLLADIVHYRDLDPQVWASNLALGGVGLIAVVAGNPLTLLLAWSIIDISEIAVLLRRVSRSAERERVVIAFSIRVAGMVLLIAGMLQAQALGTALSFDTIPPEVSGLLLFAAALRLGIVPLQQPYLHEPYQRRGLGSFAPLIPVAASLALVVRVATIGISSYWLSILMFLLTITCLYASVGWVRSTDELQGRPFWILGFATLSMAAAVQGFVVASIAWGLALLFSGSMLFLFSTRRRVMLVFPFFGAVGFSALPFTPAWEGIAFWGATTWLSQISFFAALALLLVGYLRHARRFEPDVAGFERWMWLVYPSGLLLLPLTHFGLVYLQGVRGQRVISFQMEGWWLGLVSLGVAAILLVLSNRRTISLPLVALKVGNNFKPNLIYQLAWRLYRLFGRLINLISLLLEGEGGILWALMMLILLIISLSFRQTGGGIGF